jgi:hypothetical protein
LNHISKAINEDFTTTTQQPETLSEKGKPQRPTNEEESDVDGIQVETGGNIKENDDASSEVDHKSYVGSATSTAVDYIAGRLRVRDLRKVDFSFNPVEENSITVRRHAVLFCLDPIRYAHTTHDSVAHEHPCIITCL